MTANALIIFEEDDLIRAAETNDNNRYLENKVNTVSTNLNAYLQSQVATITQNLNDQIEAVKNPTITVLSPSGTINLGNNTINTITPNAPIVFVLPNVSDNSTFHQVLVQVNLTTVTSIDVGTTHFFNGKMPDLSNAGIYNLVFEYDKANSIWVCGWMRKS